MADSGQVNFAELLRRAQLQRQFQSLQGQGNSQAGDQVATPQVQTAPQQAPPAEGPAMSTYKQAIQQGGPNVGDYHPSLGRRIGASILGAFAGAHDPRSGYEVGHAVAYAPYEKNLTAYQQRLQGLKSSADTEEEQAQNKAKIEELTERKKAETERAGAEHARRNKEEYDTSELAQQRKLEQLRVEHPGTTRTPAGELEDVIVHLKNGKKVNAIFDKSKNTFTDPLTGPIGVDAIETYVKKEPTTPKGPATPEEQALVAFAKKNNLLDKDGNPDPSQLTYDQRTQAHNEWEQATETPAQRAQRLAGAAGTTEATKEKQQKTSPETAAYYVDQMIKGNPQVIHGIKDEDLKTQVAQGFTAKTGKPIPMKLSNKDEDMQRVSQRALLQTKNLRTLLSDPDIQKSIGPILGRMGKTGEWIGEQPEFLHLTPEQQQKGQTLRALMKQILFTETQNLSGTVARANLLKELGSTSPNPNMVLPLIKGALDAIESNSKINLQTIDQLQYGSGGEEKPSDQDFLKKLLGK